MLLGFEQLDKPQWIPLAEEAVNTIFSLAEHPDLICAKILKSLASTLSTRSSEKTSKLFSCTILLFYSTLDKCYFFINAMLFHQCNNSGKFVILAFQLRASFIIEK